MEFDAAQLRYALSLLGRLLEQRGSRFEIVVVGGGSLLLRDWIDRPTTDLDIAALGAPESPSKARPLPAELLEAITDVADVVGLPTTWMNPGPTDLLDLGLPHGFASRTEREEFGGLVVHLAGRLDLIATKLYAAVDRGPGSKHVADLRALDADDGELRFGARWARTHDPSGGFATQMLQALRHLGVAVDDVDDL